MALKVLLVAIVCSLCLLPSVRAYGLTEDEIKEIVGAHNQYRGKVDPIATNMLRVVSQTIKQQPLHLCYTIAKAKRIVC